MSFQGTGTEQKLNIEQVVKLFQPDGLIGKVFKGFEFRPQQRMMMTNVIEAYNQDSIALIEAGTGTGKSLAYLIPALIWASRYKERTVISTHTITLQEQLVNKDIPLLLEALNLKLKVALVKGMNNYICLRKLEDAQLELSLFPSDESEEIQKIDQYKNSTVDGSRSELPFLPSMAAWEKVGAESDACSHHECPHYQSCYFYKARRNAEDAQILVANHALLLADLSKRAETNNYYNVAILPGYRRVILDEAHHIEEMATEYFASKLHRLDLMRNLGRLASDKHHRQQGKLPLLKEKLQSVFNKTPPRDVAAVVTRLTIDLPALRHVLNDQIHQTFESYINFLDNIKSPEKGSGEESSNSEQKLRILPAHQTHQKWNEDIVPQTQKLILTLKQYKQGIDSIEYDLKAVDHDRMHDQTKSIRLDIQAFALRIDGAIKFLNTFLMMLVDPNVVRWMEAQKYKTITNILLVDANLDIAQALVNHLFSKFPSIILCSATLTTNLKFDFIRQRLGLTEKYIKDKKITENRYDSPFDYQKQAMLVVPTDMPSPLDSGFSQAAHEHIWKIIQACRGNAFILFTSYSMLQNCYNALAKRFEDNNFKVFKQGDTNRQDLLNQFRKTNYSVLMGTDSFWEGVDVAGDALRCVIIVKLPFKVPSEPIIQARTEAILSKGGDPFFDYSVPHAIVKFKQGFGRLIRNKWDRGCIVCLDTRIITKGYGRYFLNSLPACERVFAEGTTAYAKMTEFYKKTYHLVKQNPFSQ
ncbi:MAG: DEAD/DEAH box helicase family protein [Parachlamydiaceae bacterium]|nr:DEAD/DEAH box helicase family protein [Parachlamydiaceae bacterium]